MFAIMFIINNNKCISSVSLHHKAQHVCSVMPFYVSMLRTHKDTKSRLNRIFWSSSNKFVTLKVYKSQAATKHLEFHFCNGFVRLTLRNRERRLTLATGNCRYGTAEVSTGYSQHSGRSASGADPFLRRSYMALSFSRHYQHYCTHRTPPVPYSPHFHALLL